MGEVQFAKDRKECFFLRETAEQGRESLYKFDGNAGTVVLLLGNAAYNFRVSSDGRFFLFNSIYSGGCVRFDSQSPGSYELSTDRGVFFLVNTDDGKLLDVFDWKVKKKDSAGGFVIHRDQTGIFTIYYSWEGSTIGAIATLEPRTRAFTVLWDKTNSNTGLSLPNRTDAVYQDDVVKQPRDPTLRLKDE